MANMMKNKQERMADMIDEDLRDGTCPKDGKNGLVVPLPCICEGNWRRIIANSSPLFGKKFKNDATGEAYIFVGVMHGDDDYYYCMWRGNDMHILSCVGSLKQHGYSLAA